MSAEPEAPPFEEPGAAAEPSWIGREPGTGRLLPGFPGPRYTGKVTSTVARASKLVEAMQPLVERRDTILAGGASAKSEVVRMLANSIVALDHFEKEIGARLVLDGPLTGKGASKAALTTAGNLATQKARLIDKLLPLLADATPSASVRESFEYLHDDELAAIDAILAAARARASAPAVEEPPTPTTRLRIEVPAND